MAKTRKRLASLTRLLLTVLTTTPVVMSIPVVFMLIVIPPWFRYLGLQNNGVQTQAEVITVENGASIYGRPAINVDYRFSLQGQEQTVYTGQQSVNFDPPPVGSIIKVTYSRDNPNISQIGDDPGIAILLVETIVFGFLALVGCIPTVALALRIATRIWGI